MSASDVFVTKVGPLLPINSINSIEDVPESWRPDLLVMDTIDRVTIVQAQQSLGVPDDALPTTASFGVFGTSLEKLGQHVMRVLRKIRAKQSVIRSLKAHESAGTVPPTLVIRIPVSMDTDAYARLGCDAHAQFLEMLNHTQKQALVCTIALRTAELTQLEEEYDALSQPCSIVDRLVSERFPDVSVETEPAYMLPTLRATARRQYACYPVLSPGESVFS
jgi:hypothetical protein